MTIELIIEPTGDVVEVSEEQTLLDACLRQGVWLPHACGHGLCGTCKVQVLEGEVDHGDASGFALMDFERDEGYTLACCATATEDVVIEADIDDDPDARQIPVRDFCVNVARAEPLTHDIVRLVLSIDGDALDFQAGQYMNLHLPGIDGGRPFSLANAPSEKNQLEFHVRRVPEGRGTGYIHEQLAVGDSLTVSGPYGRFFTRHSQVKPALFLAGGTGVSSPKSMILELLEKGDKRAITLIHGVRSLRDLYDREFYLDLAEQHAQFRYVPALSEPQAEDEWHGETGFVHEVAERLYDGQFAGNSAYLCGPPVMVEACIRSLMKGRLFEADIFTEKFLTQGDAEPARNSPVFKRL